MNHEHGARYVRVIVDRAIHRELDYSVPENLAERVGVGSRVRVPFRDKWALATVVAIPGQSDVEGIRPIEANASRPCRQLHRMRERREASGNPGQRSSLGPPGTFGTLLSLPCSTLLLSGP